MSARGQKWLDLYNSIPTTHDEDEGRQIANERRSVYPFANHISALLFASILAGIQKGNRITEMDWCVRPSVALRTRGQISARIKFRVDDHAKNLIAISRFRKNRCKERRV